VIKDLIVHEAFIASRANQFEKSNELLQFSVHLDSWLPAPALWTRPCALGSSVLNAMFTHEYGTFNIAALHGFEDDSVAQLA